MKPITEAILTILGFSFLTFVAFFGRLPAFRNTPIGALHRVLWIHIPKGFAKADRVMTGGRLMPGLSRFGNYMLYKKNPIVMIIFMMLVTGSASMYLPQSWPYLTRAHKGGFFLLVPPPYILLYLCQRARPSSLHLVSRENINEQLPQYPYDNILYHPNRMCKTCELPKPARSKHCSLCGTCVARCDHHCVWVNNCVGRGNHSYFIGLLLSMTILLVYTSYVTYATLLPQVHALFEAYPEWYLSERLGQDDFMSRMIDKAMYYLDVFSTGLMVGGISRAGVGMLVTMTWPLPLGLFCYHLYLIWAGMTTNETAKWGDWKEDIADGLVWAADLKVPDDVSGDGIRWPHRSKQFIVRTTDGQQPHHVHESITEKIDETSWRQIWNISEVTNIYDLGFWENLKAVLTN